MIFVLLGPADVSQRFTAVNAGDRKVTVSSAAVSSVALDDGTVRAWPGDAASWGQHDASC